MAQMTIDDVRRILVECAGAVDGVDTAGNFAQWSFEDMGYDSLALMEAVAHIKQEFGVVVPDEDILEARTPQELADLVNGLAARAS